MLLNVKINFENYVTADIPLNKAGQSLAYYLQLVNFISRLHCICIGSKWKQSEENAS